MTRPGAQVKAQKGTHQTGIRRGSKAPTGMTPDGARDKAYDEKAKKVDSVYSPGCSIRLRHRTGKCTGCKRVVALINDFCGTCRALGANEIQVMNPARIAAKSKHGRAGAKNSPWRMK